MNQRPTASANVALNVTPTPGRTASGSSTDSLGVVTPTKHRHSAWDSRQKRRVKRVGKIGADALPSWDWMAGMFATASNGRNPYAATASTLSASRGGTPRGVFLLMMAVGVLVFFAGGVAVVWTRPNSRNALADTPEENAIGSLQKERILEQQEQIASAKQRHLEHFQDRGAVALNAQQERANHQHAAVIVSEDDAIAQLHLPELKFPPFPPVTVPNMNYCDRSRHGMDQQLAQHLTTDQPAPPVVLVLGMEDTSSHLFLMLIQKLLVPSSGMDDPDDAMTMMDVDEDVGHDNVQLLQSPDLNSVNLFWAELPDTDRGNWIMHELCRQQQLQTKLSKNSKNKAGTNPLLINIQWMTNGDTVSNNNVKAKDTLKHIAAFQKLHPHHNLRVVRYKRNPLDLMIRQMVLDELLHPGRPRPHQFRGARGKPIVTHPQGKGKAQPTIDRGPTVTINKASILGKLTKLTNQQDAVDTFLHDLGVDHIVVDHQNLFPFSAWKDFVNITHSLSAKLLQAQSQSPPTDPTPLETEWKRVLEYLHKGSGMMKLRRTEVVPQLAAALQANQQQHHRQLQLQRALDAASSQNDLNHAGQMALFAQPEMVDNYKAMEIEILGTRHDHLLRNVKHEHDFYGCACNDAQRPVKKFHINKDPHEMFPIIKPHH